MVRCPMGPAGSRAGDAFHLPRHSLSMRRSNLKRSHWLMLTLSGIALGASGCGEANPGKFPEPKTPGASRAGDTPIIPNEPAKRKVLTPKQKAQMEATKNADPRGR